MMFHIFILLSLLIPAYSGYAMYYDQEMRVEGIPDVIDKSKITDTTTFSITGYGHDFDNIVISIAGEIQSFQTWKKEKVYGIWMKNKSFTIPYLHSFYHVFASDRIDKIAAKKYIDILDLDPHHAQQMIIEKHTKEDYTEFLHEFNKYRQKHNLSLHNEHSIKISKNIFNTAITLPKSIPCGTYIITFYSFKDMELVSKIEKVFTVDSSLIYRDIKEIATTHPLLYIIITILTAIFLAILSHILFSKSTSKEDMNS